MVQGHYTSYPQELCICETLDKCGEVRDKYVYSLKKYFFHDPIELWPLTTNFMEWNCTFFDNRLSVSEVWAILDEGEKKYSP